MEDLKNKLLKIATENVNKKLEEELKNNQQQIKEEIKDVNFILELIDKQMLYKVVGEWRNEKFEMITKEEFIKDYTSEPKSDWHKKGIKIKSWNGFGNDNYKLDITINDEIKYKHIGYIIKDFTERLKDKEEKIYKITEGLNELEIDFEKLKNQEKNIIKFVNDYKNAEGIINE